MRTGYTPPPDVFKLHNKLCNDILQLMEDYSMRAGCVKLDKPCEKCSSNEWICIDENNIYKQFCANCGNYVEYIKIDYLRNFCCPECNCLSGTIEENNTFLAIRCKNCKKQTIVLEKHTTENRRQANSVPQEPKTLTEIRNSSSNILKCPKCGSIAVTTGQRGYSLWTGFLGAGKTVNRCGSCGYKWKL